MILNLDGKAQETSRGFDDSLSADESRRLGELRDSSSSYGLQQSRFAKNGCRGEDSSGASALKGNSANGKILQRLKLIESKYSDYVDNQQKQLETQLHQSKAHKLELTQEIAELEQEIYNLISEASDNKEE
ncbi:hypothetical protein NIES4072_47230 [Nostoc commune NIES-4072]|uniref:Uncharacterized protein n=1 Tax=Nostoc commune NIES-4072 TaxID=2005467 RepID=A0A2R5FYW7_NOSCO|nr:hypothetical protein [Nostoc commune]BBD67965.1 hypothetical protein NIES4070_43600 [Nostoc commune HK-02]GBG21041.1 hypothetical protein NIES4072_47230 [Nostoc commune NIES-4072]